MLCMYEITWQDGKVEMVDADYVTFPSGTTHARGELNLEGYAYAHIKFFLKYDLILSAREGDVTSVRLIPTTVLQEDTTEADSDVKGHEEKG